MLKVLSILIPSLLPLFGIVLILYPYPVLAQSLSITSFTLAHNARNVAKSTNIDVIFGSDVNSAMLTNTTVRINGSLSGLHQATFDHNSGTRTVTTNPIMLFAGGCS